MIEMCFVAFMGHCMIFRSNRIPALLNSAFYIVSVVLRDTAGTYLVVILRLQRKTIILHDLTKKLIMILLFFETCTNIKKRKIKLLHLLESFYYNFVMPGT